MPSELKTTQWQGLATLGDNDGRARDPLFTRACRPLPIASSPLVPPESPIFDRNAEENIMRSCYGRGAPLRWAVYAACLSAFLFFG